MVEDDDCDECMVYAKDVSWALLGALASVGIERGKSTQQMFIEYMDDYHERGHRER